MLKKARADLESAKSADATSMSQSVLRSSRQIWLAGLGAFARAQHEGMKVFESLVKQGESLESKTRHAAASTAGAARDVAKAKAKEVQAMAGDTWDKLEQVFEDRVARALGHLGVYTAADVERLTQRVNELSEAVNALLKAQGAERKPRASTVEKHARARGKPRRRTAARPVASGAVAGAKTRPAATKAAK